MLGSRCFESVPFSQPANHPSQDLAIGFVISGFGFGLEMTVESQNLRIGVMDRMLLKNSLQRGENARLPIDEGAVAIEGDELELGEVEHKK